MKIYYSRGLSTALFIALLASLFLFYVNVQNGNISWDKFRKLANPLCDIPIEIRIGSIDPRFKIATSTILKETDTAAQVWEDALGKNLFVFNSKHKSEVVVNFVYDERQQTSTEGAQTKLALEKEWAAYENDANYRINLINKLDSLKNTYEKDINAYNVRSKNYQAAVKRWNSNPGSEAEYAALKREGAAVDAMFNQLEKNRIEINSLAAQINKLGDTLHATYNTLVAKTKAYNQNYSSDQEITVGEYNGLYAINIYEYTDINDLRITLAHELGHALGMEHTGNPNSIMYPLVKSQDGANLIATEEDLAELNRVCN